MYFGCLLYLYFTIPSFCSSIEMPQNAYAYGANAIVCGNLKHFQEHGKFFYQHEPLVSLGEKQKKTVKEATDEILKKYRNCDVKGYNFTGVESDGVFLGEGFNTGKVFLGSIKDEEMFGLYKPEKGNYLVGYFKMNDKGDIKHAGIFSNPSVLQNGFSIKYGKDKGDRFIFTFGNPQSIEETYGTFESKNKFFEKITDARYETVKNQVFSSYTVGNFNPEYFVNCVPVDNKTTNSVSEEFSYQLEVNLKFISLINNIYDGPKVYGDIFSFPIFLDGKKRKGLLCFVKERSDVFDICFGLESLNNDNLVFAPLFFISFLGLGKIYYLFDYKKPSNFCMIQFGSEGFLSFSCNLSLSGNKRITIEQLSDEKRTCINSFERPFVQGESEYPSYQIIEKKDLFFLNLCFTKKIIELKIPCIVGRYSSFNFLFSSLDAYFCYLKNSDNPKLIDNFISASKDVVLLCNVDGVLLSIKQFVNGCKSVVGSKFFYPMEHRSIDRLKGIIKIFSKVYTSSSTDDGPAFPLIMSVESLEDDTLYKDVDEETAKFLSDVFSNSNVETDSIKEDEKEPNTGNNINKADNNINEEKEEKEFGKVPTQKNVNNKIGCKHEANIKKRERKKRKKQGFLNSIESTESKIFNKISNGLKKGENFDFKQVEEVTIEYFLEGKDGKKEKGEIKYKIEDEEKKFFGEKRRIVILSKEKKVPHNFTYKGSVSEILKSGEKNSPTIHELLIKALFNLSCAKILKDSSIKMSKIKNVQIRNMDVLEVYIAHNTETEIGNQVRLLVAYDKAKKTFYALDSLCHYDK